VRHPTFCVFHTCRINNLRSALSGFEGWNRQKSGVSTVYQRKLSNVDRCLCVQRLGITTHERTACQIACTGMGSLKIADHTRNDCALRVTVKKTGAAKGCACFFILCPARSTVVGSSAARAVVQLKSTGSNCAMLDRMKKPELLITQKVGEVPVRGICSACPHVVFDIGSKRGKRGDHERNLKFGVGIGPDH